MSREITLLIIALGPDGPRADKTLYFTPIRLLSVDIRKKLVRYPHITTPGVFTEGNRSDIRSPEYLQFFCRYSSWTLTTVLNRLGLKIEDRYLTWTAKSTLYPDLN